MFRNNAIIVVDLGFGDSGKGTMVDYLARQSPGATVVRFNGGAQAAHNVHSLGRHHTFSQFGSGTFVPGVRTHLSRFVLVDPLSLVREAEHLNALGVIDAFARLTVDPDALIVTPFHKAANRIREVLRGSGNHGSVGMGVGETKADEIAFPTHAVRASDLRNPETLAEKFAFFRNLKREEFRDRMPQLARDAMLAEEVKLLSVEDAPQICALAYWRAGMRIRLADSAYLKLLSMQGDLIFEGAQGVLIDEWHGFHPYTTWSTTTYDNPSSILSEIGYRGSIQRLGVLRAYFTRHGAGPFPTEDSVLTCALPDPTNTFGRWQGGFRIGHFDAVLARYAITACGGVDSLAITNTDRVAGMPLKIATSYAVRDLSRAERAASLMRGEDIVSFRRKPFLTDLGYQETLTRIVTRAQPVYEAVHGSAIVEKIERELKIPVRIVSSGPTAAHKHVRTALKAAA